MPLNPSNKPPLVPKPVEEVEYRTLEEEVTQFDFVFINQEKGLSLTLQPDDLYFCDERGVSIDYKDGQHYYVPLLNLAFFTRRKFVRKRKVKVDVLAEMKANQTVQ